MTDDSRAVTPGALFVAIPGLHVDGHVRRRRAAAAGAAAALVERPLPDVALPQLVVERAAAALADAAAWWYGDPSLRLGVVGITGTDGKTTTSFLAAAALEAAGLSSGLVGTVASQIGVVREANPEHTTTPGAPLLQRTLRAMAEAGNAVAVVETTSHGLAADRVRGIAYDVAILTNLTHEHLEFHGSWEAYRDAKLSPVRAARRRTGQPAQGARRADLAEGGDRERRRPERERLHRRRPGGRRPDPDVRHRRHGRRPRDPGRGGRPRPPVRLHDGVGRGVARRSASRAGSTSTTPWRSSPSARSSGSTPRPSGPASPVWRACPAGWSGSTPASRSGSSSTTPTARPRSRRSSACSRRSRRPAAAA